MILSEKFRCPCCRRFAWIEFERGATVCRACEQRQHDRRRELAEVDAEIESIYRDEGGEG